MVDDRSQTHAVDVFAPGLAYAKPAVQNNEKSWCVCVCDCLKNIGVQRTKEDPSRSRTPRLIRKQQACLCKKLHGSAAFGAVLHRTKMVYIMFPEGSLKTKANANHERSFKLRLRSPFRHTIVGLHLAGEIRDANISAGERAGACAAGLIGVSAR